MQIKRIIVDEIPQNCGDCPLVTKPAWSDAFYCGGITDFGKNTITGSPCLMTYRRSDCPLEVEAEEEPVFDAVAIGFELEPKTTKDDAE